MVEANKFKLGIFVLAGIALLLAMLFFFGLSEIFEKKAKLVTFFKESVQGLDKGSPVKFRGVPIGKVTNISIRMSDKLIMVEMQVNLNAFNLDDHIKRKTNVSTFFKDFVENAIKKGLRCQLQYAGITGMKYIEIDYFNAAKIKDLNAKPHTVADCTYIPSTQSMLQDILKLINTSLEKISKVKFDVISDELAGSIRSINKLVSGPKLKKIMSKLEQMSEHLEQSSKNLNAVLTESKIRQIIDQLTESLEEINHLATEIRKEVRGAKIIETSNSFRDAALSVSEAKTAVLNTLMKLDQTLDSITEFVNYLDDDPSSLIRGKQAPLILPEDDASR